MNSLFYGSNLYLKFDNIWNGFVGKLNWIKTDGLNWIKIGNFRFGFNWINFVKCKELKECFMISKMLWFQSVTISSILVSKDL